MNNVMCLDKQRFSLLFVIGVLCQPIVANAVDAVDPIGSHTGAGLYEARPHSEIDSQRIDRLTAKAMQALARNEYKLARATLQDLVTDYPTYRLGHLLFAELHAANTSLPSSLDRSQYTIDFMELWLEASTRLRHSNRLVNPIISANDQPNDILKLGKGLEHWIQVDLEQGTQSVFDVKNGALVKRWEQYVGFGSGGFDKFKEGDLKTPLGVYRIDGFRDDESLPELYGSGALTLDYPNLADRYENRTGSGIWLHGVPRSNRSRGPLSSEGCIIMGNDYLDSLHTLLNPSTTLVALSSASAITRPNIDLNALKTAFLNWQSPNTNSVANHYANLVTNNALIRIDNNDVNQEGNLVANYRENIAWETITVVASGASSVNGEPQNVVMYYRADEAQQHGTGFSEFKALFWQRVSPGANQWQLIADEAKQSRT